jgi:hypothetical protein
MPTPKPKRSFRVPLRGREDGHQRIRTLLCFQEVYDRILDGWPLSEVARFIQEVRKESTDIARKGLLSALEDYRKSIPPAELTKRRLTCTYFNAAAEVEEGLDELKELEKLYKKQLKRIEIDIKNEENIKKLLPTTGQEFRIAREILSNYADLKMDLGLSKRHLGQVDVEARLLADVAVRYNKPEVQTVLSNPQSRKKVLSLVERLMSKSAGSLSDGPEEGAGAHPEVIDVQADSLGEELLPEEDDDPLARPMSASEESGSAEEAGS